MRWLSRTISVLRDGGVIAFPTDTVYGIGCDATCKEALERIYRIKHRKENKPLVMFIPSRDHLEMITPGAAQLVSELSQYFWPGPLTLVVKAKEGTPIAAEDGTLGVRVPNEKHILAVLHHYPNPLATTSCNLEGLPTLSNAREIKAVFGDAIDYIMGGNPPEPQIPSTVLKIAPPTLLRKGKVSIFEIEKRVGRKVKLSPGMRVGILFVCSANLCRSQMAVGLARTMMSRSIFTGSAGVFASQNFPPSLLAASVMDEIGIDIRGQSSRPITLDIVYKYDLILCMEETQRNWIVSNYPDIGDRVFLLGKFGKEKKGIEIQDPGGGEIEDYRRCRDAIKDEIKRVFKYLEVGYHD